MKLVVNGIETDISAANLDGLVAARKFCADRVVLEHNGRIVPRAEWTRVAINEGDRVEIVSFVGGG